MITSVILVGSEVVAYVLFHSVLPLEGMIGLMAFLYVYIKAMSFPIHGTLTGRYIKKKKLTATINELEKKIPELERELMEMKEITKYKVNCSTSTEKDINYCNFEHSENIGNSFNKTPTNIKVLSLKRQRTNVKN